MILWDMGLMAGDNPVAVLRLAPLILGEFANTAPDFLSPECLVDLGETGWFAMFIKKKKKEIKKEKRWEERLERYDAKMTCCRC